MDNRSENSLASALRRRRLQRFLALTAHLPRPVHILDVGGEPRFWEVMGLAGQSDYDILLLNTQPQPVSQTHMCSVVGDAADLSRFAGQSFDCVFSNSVIEHLGSYARQERMAAEIQRVGKTYFVQTPNRFFPIEPHFLLPGFQFFPLAWQIWLVQRFDLGWYKRIPDPAQAQAFIRTHRLLSAAELKRLFPQGYLYHERFCVLTKSFMVTSQPLPDF
ncbi:MAG: class I SAM-dependent methyltransferase [Chloroflexota bacterium]